MNHTALLNYFKTSLSMRQAKESSKTEDVCLSHLDNIWFKDFGEDDRRMVNLLLVDHNSRTSPEGIEAVLQKIITTLQEKPVMLNVFENKEDYLKLKNFWQKYHADGKYKAVPVEYSTGIYDKETRTFAKAYHMESELGFRYHLVYLAATGKCISKATRGMWLETIEGVLDYIRWARKDKANAKNYFFDLFGEAIDEKYYDAILNRIDEYFTIEKKTYGQVK